MTAPEGSTVGITRALNILPAGTGNMRSAVTVL